MGWSSRVGTLLAGVVIGAAGWAVLDSGSSVPDDFGQRTARWVESGATQDYTYEYHRRGMCGSAGMEVVVRAGAVAAAEPIPPADDQICGRPDPDAARTIDGLFEMLEDLYEESHSVVVDYDLSFGYPLQASIDPNERVFDEEWGFFVENFRVDE